MRVCTTAKHSRHLKSAVLFPLKHNSRTLGYLWALNFKTEDTVRIKETLELSTFFIASELANYQLMKQLEDLGVTPIEAVGKEFDPNLHNAVMQVESEEFESGMVAQELQKGYMFHDTVLRHSMVGVTQ